MWKEIKGFENYYEISDRGEVRGIDRNIIDSRGQRRFIQGKTMKQTKNASGYFVVNLRKNGRSNVVLVHVLVAENFIKNFNKLPTVNHIDGNKLNNHVSNLEWVTYAENNIHALQTGLRKPRGNRIAQLDINGNLISTYKSACEASRKTNISRGGISHCLNGRTSHAGGFAWKKLSESQTTIPQGSTQEDELPAEAQRPSTKMEDIVYPVSNNG